MFTLACEIWLPRSIDDVFRFFADARNLQRITPPWLNFRVLTPDPIRMQVGTLIDYRLRIHGLPIRWQSEITAWDPPHRFVDEQRRGPYRRWLHEHTFLLSGGGTLVQDRICYDVPGGRLIQRLFVRRDLERIFAHRRAALTAIFADRNESASSPGTAERLDEATGNLDASRASDRVISQTGT